VGGGRWAEEVEQSNMGGVSPKLTKFSQRTKPENQTTTTTAAAAVQTQSSTLQKISITVLI